MRTGPLLLALAALFSATVAEARPRHRPPPRVLVTGPRVSVVVDPWAPAWAPAARPGWVWVEGAWLGPRWRPGYWRPSAVRLGWLWVPGYWTGTVYVDGYWREEGRPGQAWVDGYYDEEGSWVPGYWAPAGSADARRDEAGSPQPEGPPVATPPADEGGIHHEYE